MRSLKGLLQYSLTIYLVTRLVCLIEFSLKLLPETIYRAEENWQYKLACVGQVDAFILYC